MATNDKREFWITRDLVTVGNKVVDKYDVHLDNTQPRIDSYNHGTEVYHVVDASWRDQALKLAAVIEHAIELGYLGEGSTEYWAKGTIAEFNKWREVE